MLTVYIVDDEKLIRDGIKQLLDWEALDCEIIGSSGHTGEAIDFILTMNPDVVIVDINMPGMNGLEMIRYLRNNAYDGRLIILSGYTEFHFAREAIRYGVQSYLTKPLDERELAGELYAARKELESKKRNQKNKPPAKSAETATDTAKPTADMSFPVKKQWELFLTGFYDCAFLEAAVDFEPTDEMHIVIVQAADKSLLSAAGAEDKFFVFEKCFEKSFEKNVERSFEKSRLAFGLRQLYIGAQGLVLLSTNHYLPTVNACRQLCKQLENQNGIPSLAFIGEAVSSLADLPQSYASALAVMKKRFIYGHKSVIGREERAAVPPETPPLDRLCEKLIPAVYHCSLKDINDILENWMNGFIDGCHDEMAIKLAYTNLYTQLTLQLGTAHPEVSADVFDHSAFVEKAYLSESIVTLTGIMKKQIIDIACVLSKNLPDNSVAVAIAYLEKNYSKNITLKSIAQLLNYNCTYFGRKFKTQTGDTLSVYLDKLRIEKAKTFLQEGHKVYISAEMAGFTDVDYFNKKFKRYVGMSPSAYKAQKSMS